MPISYGGKHWTFEALAKAISKKKKWTMDRARRYVAGIEHAQKKG